MLFQTLDDKSSCVGIYVDNNLYFEETEFPKGLTATWSPSSYLRDQDIEYASLYLEGDNVLQHIPEYLKDDWEDVLDSLKAFRRSLNIAKINLDQNCFYDLVPTRFLKEYCEVKNRITSHILTNLPRPLRYNFYSKLAVMLEDISNRKVSLDKRKLSSFIGASKLSNHAERLLKCSPYIRYNQFGTKTGRLTTKTNTFPILTVPAQLKKCIQPTNDFFVELDFNGAEVRVLLGLSGADQPAVDVHTFHAQKFLGDKNLRDKAKVDFFSWLYGSKKDNIKHLRESFEKNYRKDLILDKFYKDGEVRTIYGKKIPGVSEHHALNYIIQSTSAELTLKQALKMDYLLRTHSDSSSHIFGIVHDSVIIDMKEKDLPLLPSLEYLMSSTEFGKFKINIKKGNNLLDMKPL